MRYRRYRKIAITWSFVISFALILFLAVFFLRQGKLIKRPLGGIPSPKCEIVRTFAFSDENSLKDWEEKIFKSKVVYKIEKDNGLSYVRATSDKAASALYCRIKLDAKNNRPMIIWKWRVEKFPDKTRPESLEMTNEDDFAARLYVIFPAMFTTNSKVLEYVWSETIPVGTTGTSPYSKNIKLIVLEQGKEKDKRWFTETRDIYSDYLKLFGHPPEYDIGAIAFMTNTEHTGTTAEAMYGDIQVGYIEGDETKGGGGERED